MKSSISLILKGVAMGIAEVIPGVSGGTIAFITGIYQQLLLSIKSFDLQLINYLKSMNFKAAWNHINGSFLFKLGIGMIAGVVFGVFVVSHLLVAYPELLWSFFFGLILSSIWLIYTMMKNPVSLHLILFFVGVCVAYGIGSIQPQTGSEQYLYLFLCGTVAICALILPGISGSFLLLLLGAYTIVIPALKSFLKSPEIEELKIIVVFGLGCLTGLLVFARVLSWTFKKYYDSTLAVLAGFMLGALPKIWPWRNPIVVMDKEQGELINIDTLNISLLKEEHIQVVKELAVMPSQYYSDPRTMMVLIIGTLGFFSILLLSKVSQK